MVHCGLRTVSSESLLSCAAVGGCRACASHRHTAREATWGVSQSTAHGGRQLELVAGGKGRSGLGF